MADNTTLKARIIAIMTENTGANGRMWQRNELIDNWDETSIIELDVYDGGVIPAYSIYHYLKNFLSITPESEDYNANLQDFMSASDNSYLQDVDDFIEAHIEYEELHDVCNTYNYDNILSQILQYTIFEDEEGDYYIVLQVHNGADARGGYTTPQIFSLGEEDNAGYFQMAQTQIYSSCECSVFDSDNAGCNYYKDGNYPTPAPAWDYDTEKNIVTCQKCGKEVGFSVIESW